MKPIFLIVALMILLNCYLSGQTLLGFYAGSISLVGPSHYQTEGYQGHLDLRIKSQNLLAGGSLGLTLDTNKRGKSLLGFYFSTRMDFIKYSQSYVYGNWVDAISDYEVETDGTYEVQALSLQFPALLCVNLLKSRVNLMTGLTYRKIFASKVKHAFNKTTNYFQLGSHPSSDYYPYNPPVTLQTSNNYKRNFDKVLGTLAVRFQDLHLFHRDIALLVQLDFPIDPNSQGSIESNERWIMHLGLHVPLKEYYFGSSRPSKV